MGEQNRSRTPRQERPAGRPRTTPRWTLLEILGLAISAILVAAPLLSLGYSFLFPEQAPAAALLPSPTPEGTPTPTRTPGGPTDTPTPTVPTNTPLPTVPTNTPLPTVPTNTPLPTVPTNTPPPVTPTETPGYDEVSVEKAADRDTVQPGDTLVFTIGITNRRTSGVNVTIDDTWPGSELHFTSLSHTCAGGTISPPGGTTFHAELTVPAEQACQIVAVALVDQGCNCYKQNAAAWSGGGYSGTAHSQRIMLLITTPLATATPNPTSTPGPTNTTAPTSTPGPTSTTAPTSTPGPTNTTAPTSTPGPTSTTAPTSTPGPTSTPTPTNTPGPSSTPTPTHTPSPTNTPAPPTNTPRPGQPTERPPQPTREPTGGPTQVCAQARIYGNTCAAGVAVTISSCCPPWSARTTASANGAFEFGGLTPGTFTVSARGISRTVRLEQCTSAVHIDLCPTAPQPTTPQTTGVPPTAGPPAETTLPPGATITTTRLPGTGDLSLKLEVLGESAIFRPGDPVSLRLTLHNGYVASTLQGVTLISTVDRNLELLGAFAADGDIKIAGQDLLLSGATVAPGQDLVVRLDAVVRRDTPSGTFIALRATARTRAGDVVDSNALQLEVWGEGVSPPPPGGTPFVAPTPAVRPTIAGGPEQAPTVGPSGPESPALPPTGTGLPMVGVMLGGVVLLARQLRLRRAGRRAPDS